MRIKLLAIAGLFSTAQLLAQTPMETFSFSGGSTDGENGATSTSSTWSNTTIADEGGIMNSAISLDGSEQITYNGLAINPYDGMSVSFWVKPSSSMTQNKGYALFSQRTSCSGVHSIEAFVNGSQNLVSFTLRSPSGGVGVNTSYTPDVWQHFTFTFNQTDGKMRVYKDGEHVATGANSTEESNIPTSISGDFAIGYNPCVAVDGTLQYSGGLDELKIYDEKLSDLEIKLLANPAVDIAAYQDSVATHSIIEHYNFNNFVEGIAVQEGFIQDNAGNPNSALQMDGASSKTTTVPTSTSGGYTVSLWLNPDAYAGARSQVILSQRSACTGVNSIELYRSSTEVSFVVRTAAGGQAIRVPYTSGQWVKYTFVADAVKDSLYAYSNGVFVSQGSAIGRIPGNVSTSTLRIGTSVCVAGDGTPQYTGGIDQLYIYDKNLTTQEIADAYTQNDNDQFNPVLEDEFDFTQDDLTETLRSDPFDNSLDTALVLNGNSGFNLNAETIATDGEGYTFSFWIQPDGTITANNQVLFAKRDQCTWRDLFVANVNGTTQQVSMELRTLDAQVKSLQIDYTPDVWQLMTYVVDLNELYIYGYVDGEKIDSASITGHEVPASYSNSVTLKLSASPCTYSNYTGGIDELQIYGAPLASIEVAKLYDASVTLNTWDTQTNEGYDYAVYPSPASSHVFVEPGLVQVFDLSGNLLINTESKGRLDVSALSKGVYVVIQADKRARLIIE